MQPLQIAGTELLDALVTGVFLLDHDLQVNYLNAAAQTLLGLGPNQALEQADHRARARRKTLLPLLERARRGGEGVVQRELAWPAPGGADRISIAQRPKSPSGRRAASCCSKSKTSPSTAA